MEEDRPDFSNECAEVENDTGSIGGNGRKRCRMLRKQTEEQANRLCEKEERSALLKTVSTCFAHMQEISIYM